MSDYETPNISIPLANSYNERGINGYAATVTAQQDQRKINCFYELIRNSVSGQSTVYLTKRPGTSIGDTIDSGVLTSYLIAKDTVAALGAHPWVFSADTTNFKVTQGSGTNTIATDVSSIGYPAFVDTTILSGVVYNVVQLRKGLYSSQTQRVFFANLSNSWTEITDTDFTSLSVKGKIEHLDGYAFIMTLDNYIVNSDLNSLSSWTANNKIQKTIKQDYPAGLAKLGQIILAFGTETVEGFVNAGNPSGSPLQRRPDITADIGLAYNSGFDNVVGRRHYTAVLNKKLFFVGNQDVTGIRSIAVFAFNGASFDKVSTPAVDKILAGASSQISHIQKIAFYGKEAISIWLGTLSGSTQHWLMFFPDVNEWFEWTSTKFSPVSDGHYFLGVAGVNDTQLSEFSISTGWVDGGSASYAMSVQFILPKRSNGRKFMSWAAVEADTAGASSPLSVEFSDNDYASFQGARTIELSGDTKRIDRCGSFRNRAVRLTHSANSECRLEKFIARIK